MDPEYVKVLVEKVTSEKLDSFEVGLGKQIEEKVAEKFDTTLGRWMRRIKWAVGGAMAVVTVLAAALALDRSTGGQYARHAFNSLSGFDTSLSESLPKKFSEYVSSTPFLVSTYSHTEELHFENCRRKVRSVPFHFEGNEKQTVQLFLSFRPYSENKQRMAVSGSLNLINIPNVAFESENGDEWKSEGRNLADIPKNHVSDELKTRTLTIAIAPTPSRTLDDLSGMEPLSTESADSNLCSGMGGELEILLKVTGDPRYGT